MNLEVAGTDIAAMLIKIDKQQNEIDELKEQLDCWQKKHAKSLTMFFEKQSKHDANVIRAMVDHFVKTKGVFDNDAMMYAVNLEKSE